MAPSLTVGLLTQGEIMFLGLRTAIYHVDDIAKGKAWYAQVLGFEPYFDQPFYVGFNVGGYELGLQPALAGNVAKADGAVAYWGVENAEAARQRMLELGATTHEPLQDVGKGIKVATVKDPFGNVFGIIENPHFKIQ
jgi:predicted enzyme related to lactoylglutathione lyase